MPPPIIYPTDIEKNACLAKKMSWYPDFYNAVKSRGQWDFKQNGKEYENFGNYHFGVVAAAAGFPLNVAKLGAGLYQLYTDLFDKRPGISGFTNTNFDEAIDQYWITWGYIDYMNGRYNSQCECMNE